jgi:hypothetical protein
VVPLRFRPAVVRTLETLESTFNCCLLPVAAGTLWAVASLFLLSAFCFLCFSLGGGGGVAASRQADA